MSAVGGAAVYQTAHVLGQTRDVEGAVLHPHVDVVGPGVRVEQTLGVGQHVTGVSTGVVDLLPLFEQLDGPVYAWHGALEL